MTKVKLKDVTRELAAGAAKAHGEAARMRQGAEGLLKALRDAEQSIVRAAEEREEEQKRIEQQKKLSDHSKAYVMLDADEQAQLDAAAAEAARVKAAKEAAAKEAAAKAAAAKEAAAKSAARKEEKPA